MNKLLTIGIILLFVGMIVSSSSGFNLDMKSTTLLEGNILYVGGSGEGNYSKIQDAIDNASDGDTVFVYNGIYIEYNITIDKSIDLIGENRNTTIMNSSIRDCNILIIIKDNTTVKGFTIYGNSGHGILIQSSDNKVLDCRFTRHKVGIFIGNSSNVISHCEFIYVNWGIEIIGRKDITIDNCNFTTWSLGVAVESHLTNLKLHNCVFYYIGWNGIVFDALLEDSNISNCKFIEINGYGLLSNRKVVRCNFYQCIFINNELTGLSFGADSFQVNITRCYFEGNLGGLFISKGDGNYIYRNNFINGRRHNAIGWGRNNWDIGKIGNYWDDWIGIKYKFLRFLPYRVRGLFNWDWHPAQEPYDIEV